MRDRLIEAVLLGTLLLLALVITRSGSAYLAQTLFNAGLAILLAIGWNVIGGFTGYVSFGQVSFFGVGAYVAALATTRLALPWPMAIAAAALGAIILALPLGLIMLRLSGIFFALGMFGLARILQISVSAMRVTGGPMGMSFDAAEDPHICAAVMLLVAAAALAATWLMLRSRFGLRLLAIRDDAVAASASGVHVWSVKVLAFCLSAALAAVGGALYAWNLGYLDPSSAFNGTIELQSVLMVTAGGIGTVWGPLVGGATISVLSTFLWARFPMEQQIVLGGLTILIAVAMPGGAMAALARRGVLRRTPVWAPPPAVTAAPATAPAMPDKRAPVLRCFNLGIRFGGVLAVKAVDLVAYPAEMLAVIGPNGAGKSTLFNLISAFARPATGHIVFDGKRLPPLRPERLARSGIARTFQTSRLFASLTVWETVLLAALSLHRNRRRARTEAARILAQVGLLEQWREVPETLPPGRQRLLEIARALALQPKVLLLDEAMAGMSAEEIARVHAALRHAMAGGCAVVAIEHVLPAIAPLAARVQVLDFGVTIAEGHPHAVLNDPAVITAYLGVELEDPADVAA